MNITNLKFGTYQWVLVGFNLLFLYFCIIVIKIKDHISIPKYQQIVFSVEKAIIRGKLKKGDKIPSINAISLENNLSRDTVLMAFNELKTRGIIESVVGKGYYITSENVSIKQKALLLFDELNAFKEDLYNAFISNLDSSFDVDIYFHHFNPHVFSTIIENNIGDYSFYIIMPANLKGTEAIINKLPEDRVYILDQMPKELKKYPAIYQNFKKDIFDKLNSLQDNISKYHTLVFISSDDKQPEGMKKGFIQFCETHHYPYLIVNNLDEHLVSKGNLYILPDDKDLLGVIKQAKSFGLFLPNDIGIISYNDTLLKDIVEGGITTISTDFKFMGKRLAQMIMHNEHQQIENPNKLIIRHSL